MVNTEFKIDDWVIGWHANFKEYKTKAWQIGKINSQTVNPKECLQNGTGISDIRHAKNEEIPIEYRTNISELIEIW